MLFQRSWKRSRYNLYHPIRMSIETVGWHNVPVYIMSKLAGGDEVVGPALIIDSKHFMTIVGVYPAPPNSDTDFS